MDSCGTVFPYYEKIRCTKNLGKSPQRFVGIRYNPNGIRGHTFYFIFVGLSDHSVHTIGLIDAIHEGPFFQLNSSVEILTNGSTFVLKKLSTFVLKCHPGIPPGILSW